MGVITTGHNYNQNDQVTAANQNAQVNDARFTDDAVDDSSTMVNGSGAIVVKDQGITPQKVAGFPNGDLLIGRGGTTVQGRLESRIPEIDIETGDPPGDLVIKWQNSQSAIPVNRGGTGARTAQEARANLGINPTGQVIPLPVAQGGTDGTDAFTARTNLRAQQFIYNRTRHLLGETLQDDGSGHLCVSADLLVPAAPADLGISDIYLFFGTVVVRAPANTPANSQLTCSIQHKDDDNEDNTDHQDFYRVDLGANEVAVIPFMQRSAGFIPATTDRFEIRFDGFTTLDVLNRRTSWGYITI